MYEPLIAALRNVSEYDSGYAKLMYDAADAIEQLSNAGSAYGRGWTLGYDAGREESKPRWIPVTERLPEIDEKHHCSKDVLAYLKDGGMCFTALEENIFGQACFECERNPAVEEEMIVTHWMPLPEPPKEET